VRGVVTGEEEAWGSTRLLVWRSAAMAWRHEVGDEPGSGSSWADCV
jgi:hypothetical protein